MSQSIRLFVGVRPDADSSRAWQTFRAKAPAWPLRWMEPDSLHITMKFLGQTSADVEPKIVSALNDAVSKTAPFSLRLKSGGVFPSKGAPAIFWVGVDGDTAALQALAAVVEGVCAPLGFPTEERAFHPHITVARALSKEDGAKDFRWLRAAFQEWSAVFEGPAFAVETLALLQSHLSARGSRYEERTTIQLQRNSGQAV